MSTLYRVEADLQKINSINFWKEAEWLKSIIDKEDCPVLFCHNDLQEGNILLRESNGGPLVASFHGSLDSLRFELNKFIYNH